MARTLNSVSLIHVDYQSLRQALGDAYQGKITISRIWAKRMGFSFSHDPHLGNGGAHLTKEETPLTSEGGELETTSANFGTMQPPARPAKFSVVG